MSIQFSHVALFILGAICAQLGLYLYDRYYKKKGKKRVIENVGPELPRVVLRASIKSYMMNDKKDIIMYLNFGDDLPDIKITVPEIVPRRFPIGTDVDLVMQLKGK